ncbi:DsbA family oxidoreductase [Zhihengliuella flava]|uniref:DsbA family dithiol-disulfide isomerase n=1 Tax=Zhihengliuella flava TaxID=1285193 RepID=A0A931DE07_9MICC|nr:DsbA family oxidoreductase [Zhihengliuella flava]MBG6085073.1 putative DsbA family dithiol-disulfide isomerase [Zhihengliuella flava]
MTDSSSRLSVDIWSDVACPWCYIGKRRFEAAVDRTGLAGQVDITWHSYQLDPALPEHYEGTELDYLAERKFMPRETVAQMFEHVTQQAAGEGLSYDFERLRVANTFTAHRLLHLAAEHGVAGALKEALLSAHFERGLDIGAAGDLTDVAVGAGVPRDAVERVLNSDEHADAVRADIAAAGRLGITGVPFFVLNNKYGLSGAQPVEVFAQALTQAAAELTPLTMVGTTGSPGTDGAACGPEGCHEE